MPCTLKAAKGWIYRYNPYIVFRRGAYNFASADCKGAGAVLNGRRSCRIKNGLLLSYFSFNLQDLKLNFNEPLDMREMEELMSDQGL